MEFCELVRKERQLHFKTPKDFHRKAGLKCSYYYYCKIEHDTLPEIGLATAILKALKTNLRKGLYAWVRDQMPDKETRAFFTELGDTPPRSSEQNSLERSLVVNRMQAKLLMSDPVYWELLVFISSYHGHSNPDEHELSKNFGLPVATIRKLMQELYDYGLIEKPSKGRYGSKEWIFIPYDQEFEALRDINFKRALDQFNRQTVGKFRTTITRPLSKSQQREIEAKVLAFSNSIVDMEDIEPPEAELCTIGLFASPRRFGEGNTGAPQKGRRK